MEALKAAPALEEEPRQGQAFYRLTALWALSEGFLGGVLHATHLPGTGLFVGGAAVLCMSLLAKYGPGPKSILRALWLVQLAKAVLSPQTPIGAYFAVAVQGCLGYLLLRPGRFHTLSCFALGILTQLQSALQRLLVMLIVFGGDVYEVANGFVNFALKKMGLPGGDYVYSVVALYLGVHLLMGVVVGWLAASLPVKLANLKMKYERELASINISDYRVATLPGKLKRKKKQHLFVVLTLAVVVVIFWCFKDNAALFSDRVVWMLFRGALVLAIWYTLVAPLLLMLFRKILNFAFPKAQHELQLVLSLLPELVATVKAVWAYCSRYKGHHRAVLFLSLLACKVL